MLADLLIGVSILIFLDQPPQVGNEALHRHGFDSTIEVENTFLSKYPIQTPAYFKTTLVAKITAL
jgi:hypothetical protein